MDSCCVEKTFVQFMCRKYQIRPLYPIQIQANKDRPTLVDGPDKTIKLFLMCN